MTDVHSEDQTNMFGVFVLGLTPTGVRTEPREGDLTVRVATYVMDSHFRYVDPPVEIHEVTLEVKSTGEYSLDFTYTHTGDNADYLRFSECCFWTRRDPSQPAWIGNPPHWNYENLVNYMINNASGNRKSLLPSPNGRYLFRIPYGFTTPRPHPSITGASVQLATLFDALTAPNNAFYVHIGRFDA